MTKITTVLMDYDGTLHDLEGVAIRMLDGATDLTGEELYNTWKYRVHRGLIHTRYLDRHDDMQFHCKLLFKVLGWSYDQVMADDICARFDETIRLARTAPTYFPDAIPALDRIKEAGLTLCLSTGTSAEEKAATLARTTGRHHFDHVFSEPRFGYLKTETEYYRLALRETGSSPWETASIGDTPLSDIRPARLAGIQTVWLNRRGEPTPTDPEQRAHHEAADLEEALSAIGI
jgi:HAD superfamily hydrolase (TIGR01549 family)